jgi:hypothetical protein
VSDAQINDDTSKMIRNIVRDDAKKRAERFGYQASLEKLEQLAADRELTQAMLERLKANDFCGF